MSTTGKIPDGKEHGENPCEGLDGKPPAKTHVLNLRESGHGKARSGGSHRKTPTNGEFSSERAHGKNSAKERVEKPPAN